MLRRLIPGLVLAAIAALPAMPDTAEPRPFPCPAAAQLAALGDERVRGQAIFKLTSTEREAMARALLPCLGDPDPLLRDDVAYSVLSHMMRNELIGPETVAGLRQDLLSQLAGPDDEDGFARPFAALVLAEIARTDRIAPWMSDAERDGLIAAAHDYLAGLTDYRGFSDREGWRHGVAHAADLLMQLSLSPQLTKPQAEAILAAVALQAGPTGHAYVFGESDRLAAPVLYLARRDFLDEDAWTAWFAGLWPNDDPLRTSAYASSAALTKLHNLRALSRTIYTGAAASEAEAYAPVRRAALAFLNALP